ncbi:PH, RCC1 and FYVE domains-containing protein 1-like [Macadamia integrifolia]|uniref:PH, RCC1 and FYVE domains-containing protein 1-like n=1 Tax=Macadamia integrifolia TaxID=60698 RepID=UPI001C4F4065|nr:PH, RCC1 and FYVE domains-containing protein 1-like [Macadamia integrifolia]
MADPVGHGNSLRDFEPALIALKKGTQLIKYSRRGKPKLCPFRVSVDETTLIWYSHGEERSLKLSSVSRIIPGQRTAVFRRYFRPDKDYLSFSLLYNNGARTLDLICKDKDETETWFAGLKALLSKGQYSRHTRSESSDLHDNIDFIQNGHHLGTTQKTASRSFSSLSSLSLTYSDFGPDHANMQARTITGDGSRVSFSSTSGLSSVGLGTDDIESLGDVYVWGEVWCDKSVPNGSVHHFPSKTDVLTPRPLDSNVVLDVQQVSSGIRHAALVTRQGEIFTWGEESGGRLGHGTDRCLIRPQLVESFVNSVDYVACGEYHTCAVTATGDLFTWGDGTHYPGLLGHGKDVSHWVPKRISGPLEGLQVLSVACGTWHSALVTFNGKLFTFGDGTFGVLGHGDRENVAYPREIQSLSESKTLKVACGLWHTAAIVEVMGQSGTKISPKQLFTWGDGDKYRLGHGDKESKLKPTRVSSLISYNFHQLACGPNITTVLATSGHVFTMGSTAYGQLGNPLSDGKLPCLVQNRLVGEFVEEISCGSLHVAVRTSRGKVFTWGRGANGRLGHGDTKDRKVPNLVESLKDRLVKSISCGANFTAAVCLHKWVSGTDHSVCSSCRQAFCFTRKRRNCYNCGLVHCYACCSKKALGAALSPTPSKPLRVCDSCYFKLKASEAGSASTFNKNVAARHPVKVRERLDRGVVSASKNLLSLDREPIKYLDIKPPKQGMKSDSASIIRASPVQRLLQQKDAVPSPLISVQHPLKRVITSAPQPLRSHPSPLPPSVPQPAVTSRAASPYSRKSNSPHVATPVISKSFDTIVKKFEHLSQEVRMLQSQAKRLRQKCENQDMELQKSRKQAEEAASLAARESSRCKVANEVMKSSAVQLKEMMEKLPAEGCDIETFKAMCTKLEALHKRYENQDPYVTTSLTAGRSYETQESEVSSLSTDRSGHVQPYVAYKPIMVNGSITCAQYQRIDGTLSQNAGDNDRTYLSHIRRPIPSQSLENGSSSLKISKMKNVSETEATELFEPGVYVTLIQLQNGAKFFKGVRFSKRKFAEQQAEHWWKENKDRVLKKYITRRKSIPTESYNGVAHAEEDEAMSPSQNWFVDGNDKKLARIKSTPEWTNRSCSSNAIYKCSIK